MFADHDAAVLAISFDTALLGARQIVADPGDRHDRGQPADRLSAGAPVRPDQLRAKQPLDVSGSRAACRAWCSGWLAFETIDLTNSSSYLREGGQDAAVIDASGRLIAAGADTIVVAGAAVAGIAHRLRAQLSVPLLDGIACAVGQAETLVRLGLRQRAAVAPLTGGSATIGIDPPLSQRTVALSAALAG